MLQKGRPPVNMLPISKMKIHCAKPKKLSCDRDIETWHWHTLQSNEEKSFLTKRDLHFKILPSGKASFVRLNTNLFWPQWITVVWVKIAFTSQKWCQINLRVKWLIFSYSVHGTHTKKVFAKQTHKRQIQVEQEPPGQAYQIFLLTITSLSAAILTARINHNLHKFLCHVLWLAQCLFFDTVFFCGGKQHTFGKGNSRTEATLGIKVLCTELATRCLKTLLLTVVVCQHWDECQHMSHDFHTAWVTHKLSVDLLSI